VHREVSQFGGGASNLTSLLRYPGRDLVLRRPPTGQKAASAHGLARECRVQQRLEPA
jgi:aminoglycoside phosphotransferase (APT) family kinase protein